MKHWLILTFGIYAFAANAQTFTATGRLDSIPADGFYKILLSPHEAPYLNRQVSNTRILNAAGQETPYLLQEEQFVYHQQSFREYAIVSKKQANRQTTIQLHNAAQAPIDNISLLIKNAEVNKIARLSGSDDGQTWYAVKENFTLNPIVNTQSVNELRGIKFPLTNYTYYLLEISDSASAPLNILKAGYYDYTQSQGLYSLVNDSVAITTTTKDKRTYIYVNFKQPQIIDKLEVNLSGLPYFQRNGFITTRATRTVKKKTEQYDNFLDDFTVRSGQPSTIQFHNFKTDNLTLCIENGDNPALTSFNVSAWQLNRYLTAWLEKDKIYTVKFGDEKMAAPQYDIRHFRDSIPKHAQVIQIKNVQPAIAPQPDTPDTLFTSKTIIWIAIGAVIILLGIMSLKLVNETNNKPKA